MNLLVYFSEGCNEGIMVWETEGRGFYGEIGGNAVRGGWCNGGGRGVCENPVRFSLNDGPMETVE